MLSTNPRAKISLFLFSKVTVVHHACVCMSYVIWNQQEAAAEEMCWMAAKCTPAAEGQFLYRSARHLGLDSPLHTYTACTHYHIAFGPPIRLHMDTFQPAGQPIACRPRHQIGILQRASPGLAIP